MKTEHDDTCGACWGSGWETQFVTPCRECGGKGTITLPEKPDNSLNPAAPMIDILNHAMKVSDQISKVVEPSESQEEMMAELHLKGCELAYSEGWNEAIDAAIRLARSFVHAKFEGETEIMKQLKKLRK